LQDCGIVGKRLFIAVDIDASTRQQIKSISDQLRSAVEARTKASWVRPDRMHLTLHFFGDASPSLEQHVRTVLDGPIAEAPFDISFQGLGFFPERGSPRVLWLGMRDGVEALRRIHAVLAGRVTDRTAVREPHSAFTPHLTLARLRERTSRAGLAEIGRIPAVAGPSRIDRVTLYESRLSSAGPAYVPLAEALLLP
jgi:2'-5' RNA ligase